MIIIMSAKVNITKNCPEEREEQEKGQKEEEK